MKKPAPPKKSPNLLGWGLLFFAVLMATLPKEYLMPLLMNLLLFGGFVFVFIWIYKRASGASSNEALKFGQTKAKHYAPQQDKRTTFADVAGCDEAKEELWEIVEFLKNPAEFSQLGAKVPKGVLLHGLPGTGKTLLARAVAGEAGVPFFSASGSEFIEMFVGVGAARVRNLFDIARQSAPSIVFIDEIDAIGKKRGMAISGGHDEREQALNQMLAELDGFDQNSRIIVIAATNRPDILDAALTRPGRFDRQVMVPAPDLQGREAILKIHTRNIKMSPDVNLLDIAKDMTGMTGADLANMVNEAALFAGRKKKEFVEQSDFSEAVDKVTMGPARKSMKLSEEEKRIVAYHEAGHVLIAELTECAEPVHKVTIIPRGPALGFTKQTLEEDRYLYAKNQFEAQVAVFLGGRAAEELVFNEATSAASKDLEEATEILKGMVYELGMSEAGLAVYKEKNDFWGIPTGLDASQKTKEKLEKAVESALEKIYANVGKILRDNRRKLDALAEALLEKETLNAEEIKEILAPR